jgi:regulator of protease activity HflC (stomatin/prohibitin superfamily)
MTADDVTMDVSLLYTYRVVDPVRYQLEVVDPDRIVAGYIQGTLRDVVNTRMMDEVMHSRADINQEVIEILQKKEDQYGIEFILVQIQSASPPAEVVNAIKDRMVAVQLQEQAAAEAEQQRTLAEQYIQVLIAQELRQNSKWIISNGEAMPVIGLRESAPESQQPEAP